MDKFLYRNLGSMEEYMYFLTSEFFQEQNTMIRKNILITEEQNSFLSSRAICLSKLVRLILQDALENESEEAVEGGTIHGQGS